MRILVLAPQPFFVQRGTPIAVRLLLETLAKRGDELDVIIFPGGEDIEIPGCRFFRVLVPGLGVAGKVSFYGPCPLKDLGRYLRAAVVVASPRTQGINTPMKAYSYLDSGRPLIAMLVDPEPDDMARGVAALLSDAGLRNRLAAAAAERVNAEFSKDRYARKLYSFFEHEIEPKLSATGNQP